MFTASPARKQNQPSCPPSSEWTRNVKYTHKIEFYSVTKQNEKKKKNHRWIGETTQKYNEPGYRLQDIILWKPELCYLLNTLLLIVVSPSPYHVALISLARI
jgi:hypothetical protein